MARHIIPAILQVIIRFSREGRTQLEIAAITGVSQGVISPILKRSREIGSPKPSRHSQRSTNSRQERVLLRIVRYNRFQSSSWLRIKFNLGNSVHTINWRFLPAGYTSRKHTRCPRITWEHRRRRRQWARRRRDWDLRHCRHCVFSDESHFKLYWCSESAGNKQMTMWCHLSWCYGAPFTSGARAG